MRAQRRPQLDARRMFGEFMNEIRVEKRSHVLFMPQYAEPLGIRTAQAVLDVIRDYPGYSSGSRHWDDRVFHPDQSAVGEQQISALWKAPPAFIERIFAVMRLMENAALQRVLGQIFKDMENIELRPDHACEAMS